MFIYQLSRGEKFAYYKRIKAALIDEGVYTFENLETAMNSKIQDIQDLLRG